MASRFLNLRGVPDQGLGKEGLSRVTGLQTERFEAKSSFANTTADASHSGDQQPGGYQTVRFRGCDCDWDIR